MHSRPSGATVVPAEQVTQVPVAGFAKEPVGHWATQLRVVGSPKKPGVQWERQAPRVGSWNRPTGHWLDTARAGEPRRTRAAAVRPKKDFGVNDISCFSVERDG